MKVFSSQWSLQFKQLQMNPKKKKIGTSTGFERMASALKTHTLGAGQFVEFILTREWNEAMKMMRTVEIQILNEDLIVAVVIAI